MKKLLCAGFALFLLVSCQDDDNNGTNPTTTKGSNFTTTQTQFDDLTGKVYRINVSKYFNGRPEVFNYFKPDNTPSATTKFVYDTNNRISKALSYNASNVVIGSAFYTYDNQSRLTKIETTDGTYSTIYTFTHNSDKTITGKRTSSDGFEETKTWYVNSKGLVYKEANGSKSYEITFDEKNVVSAKSNDGPIRTFEYDEKHDRSSLGTLPVFGDYKPNNILDSYYLQDSETSASTNYLIKELSNGEVSELHNWEFDAAGKPTKHTNISDGKTVSVTTYKFD
jgi:hypothetical protein